MIFSNIYLFFDQKVKNIASGTTFLLPLCRSYRIILDHRSKKYVFTEVLNPSVQQNKPISQNDSKTNDSLV